MAGLARDFPRATPTAPTSPSRWSTSIVGDLGPILIIVMSATGLLLLLACVNVTNLLLGARRGAGARDGGPRRARRQPRPHRPPAADRVGAARDAGRGRSASRFAFAGVRALLALGASKLPRLDVVPFDARVLRLRARWCCSSAACWSASRRRCGWPRTDVQDADEREHPIGERRPRHGALAERDDRRRDRAGDHARRRRRLAGAQLLQPARRPIPGSSRDERLIFDVSFRRADITNRRAVPDRVARTRCCDRLRALPGVTASARPSTFPLRGRSTPR